MATTLTSGSSERYWYSYEGAAVSYGDCSYTVSLSGTTLTVTLTIKGFGWKTVESGTANHRPHKLDITYGGTTKTISGGSSSSKDTNTVTFAHDRAFNEITVCGNSSNAGWASFGEEQADSVDELIIEWAAINTAPTVNLTVPTLMAGQSATLSWTISDADGDTVKVNTLYRYYKASGASSFTATMLNVDFYAKSYTDTIPESYVGGQVYYKLTVKDDYSGKTTVTSATQTIPTNTAPTAPGIPSFSEPEDGKALAISWTAASDADSNLSGYILEAQLDSGIWTQIYKGSARTYNYTIPIGTETIAFRVKAYDSEGAESSYNTSSTTEVLLDPSTLTFVEYIESTGTQYIDTGVSVPHASSKIIIEFAPTEISADNPIVGYTYPSWNWNTNLAFVSSSKILLANTYGPTVEKDVFYKLEYTSGYYKFNDGDSVTLASATYTDGYNNTISFASGKYGKIKIKSYKLYDNDVLVRDFYPAVNAKGEAGLYDAVNNKFYKNAGTGKFIVPRLYDSLPSGYILATYIESSGTQYIDTGFTPNQDTRIDISVMAFSTADAGAGTGFIPYGAGVNYNSNAFECYTSGGQLEFNYANEKAYVCDAITNSIYNISHNKTSVSVTGAVEASYTFPYTAISVPRTMTLFAINRASVFISDSMRLYSCQIYDNGSLIRDYLPCVEEATGKIGLFDLQDGLFYPFQGTYTVKAVVEGAINGYVNIDGINKKILREYENINGVLRLGSNWQTNINGVLKSSSYEQEYTYDLGVPTYTWKKYTVKETEGAPYTQTKSSSQTITVPSSYYWMAKSFTFDANTGIYTLSSPSLKTVSNIKSSTYPYFQASSSTSTGTYSAKNYMYQTTKSSAPSYDYDLMMRVTTGYEYAATPSYTYSAGDYVSEVTSTSASAYPENGKHTDGYWYILKQIQ